MFTLPDLPYDYSDLEPFIDGETMHLHHDKHHAAYVKNVNEMLVGNPELLSMDPVELYLNIDKVPEKIRQKIKNNLGGHINHSMFWEFMTPVDKYEEPKDDFPFVRKLENDLGSWSGFQEYFREEAMNRFGSGWAWLVIDGARLDVVSTANQDNPLLDGLKPILGLDVWEHAYYLKYKNMRIDYINAWWNIVNWKKVEELFVESINSKGGDTK